MHKINFNRELLTAAELRAELLTIGNVINDYIERWIKVQDTKYEGSATFVLVYDGSKHCGIVLTITGSSGGMLIDATLHL